jgi:SpoVK/Ycf46/Vps4 family AAA+-type ATPase
MANHLREAHLHETIDERKKQIKDIDRDLKNRVPGFHRENMAEQIRARSMLLEDLEDLRKIAAERTDK